MRIFGAYGKNYDLNIVEQLVGTGDAFGYFDSYHTIKDFVSKELFCESYLPNADTSRFIIGSSMSLLKQTSLANINPVLNINRDLLFSYVGLFKEQAKYLPIKHLEEIDRPIAVAYPVDDELCLYSNGVDLFVGYRDNRVYFSTSELSLDFSGLEDIQKLEYKTLYVFYDVNDPKCYKEDVQAKNVEPWETFLHKIKRKKTRQYHIQQVNDFLDELHDFLEEFDSIPQAKKLLNKLNTI